MKRFVTITCGATCFSGLSPNLHTHSDFTDLSWRHVAPQSIRPSLYNGQFCLFCEKNQSTGSNFLCKQYFSPTKNFSTVARLQRCHPLAFKTYNVLSGDKIFCPLTGILRQVILYNEHLWSQVQAWFQTWTNNYKIFKFFTNAKLVFFCHSANRA